MYPEATINEWPDVINPWQLRDSKRMVKGSRCKIQHQTPKPLTGQHLILVFWERLGDVWNLQSPGIPQLKKWACRLNTLSLERMDRFFCEGKQLFKKKFGVILGLVYPAERWSLNHRAWIEKDTTEAQVLFYIKLLCCWLIPQAMKEATGKRGIGLIMPLFASRRYKFHPRASATLLFSLQCVQTL